MRTASLVFVGLSLATSAHAWDTKKFNAKTIEKEWGMPAFSKNVVGNEVMTNDEANRKSAEWAVKKVDVKAVVEFYSEKLAMQPEHKTLDTGDERYVYKFPWDKDKRVVRRVLVKYDNDDHMVHIRFWDAHVPEGEDPPEDD